MVLAPLCFAHLRPQRYCSSEALPVGHYEARLTTSAKKGDFEACAKVLQSMQAGGHAPTPRVYLVVLQMYSDAYASDPEMSLEGARTTFDKAHANGATTLSPALWSVMMHVYAKSRASQDARALDRLRHLANIPVPEGSIYTEALCSAISSETQNFKPPAGLRHHREYNKAMLRRVHDDEG